ncbi:LysR family transcriptional regulator [Alkalilimnicola ehrlichii]|uniref:LysR family transcriptional regulator n=1 Tax=Alkalilimnicola ehrlichii TaxID=351052 RepID=A0A3E0X1L3_9GAMM|nr:LysR family transcriptional regulator [Alkalilimnicola ehrlichii]RFA30595.1 LysR family transcriptional regulator [Alkalilimnicola ehrlichii]RFA38145.1 LysR family transcriptional regulator [Alkalilimnicola ehrlichii]
MQNLNDMYYFAQVAEHGSFTAAAYAVGMPKSTLSRRISRLEEGLGVRLLHRTTRRLTLTDIGREYLRHCQEVLAAAEAASEAVQRIQGEPSGLVRVTAPLSVSQTLLARAVPEFLARYPKVRIDLEASSRRVDLIADGVDVAIRVRSSLEDSSLVMRRFGISRLILVASPELLVRYGEPRHPVDLSMFPSLSLRFTEGRHIWELQGRDGESLTISHQPRLTTDDMWVLRDAAAEGVGITALPGFVCHEYLAGKRLANVLPDWSLPTGQLHAVYPYRRGLVPAVRHFIDFLAARLPVLAEEMGVSSRIPS